MKTKLFLYVPYTPTQLPVYNNGPPVLRTTSVFFCNFFFSIRLCDTRATEWRSGSRGNQYLVIPTFEKKDKKNTNNTTKSFIAIFWLYYFSVDRNVCETRLIVHDDNLKCRSANPSPDCTVALSNRVLRNSGGGMMTGKNKKKNSIAMYGYAIHYERMDYSKRKNKRTTRVQNDRVQS